MPERDLKTVRDEETRTRTTRALLEARQNAAGRRIFTGGVGSPPRLCGLKVTALHDDNGSAWTSFDDPGGFLAFVAGNPCDLAGGNLDVETTRYVKASNPNGDSGFEKIAVGHVVGYLPCDGTEEVPGVEPTEHFAGVLIEGAGSGRPARTARVIESP